MIHYILFCYNLPIINYYYVMLLYLETNTCTARKREEPKLIICNDGMKGDRERKGGDELSVMWEVPQQTKSVAV